MGAVQKKIWYFLVHVVLLFSLKDAALQKVKLEDGMVLECVCPWAGNLSLVSWTKNPERRPIAVYHPQYGVYLHPAYEGRLQFLKASAMDGSVSISNVSEADVGDYRCSVQTFPLGPWVQFRLVENTVSVVPREADTEVVADKRGNVTLTCSHALNGTVSRVTIEKVVRGGWKTVAVCQLTDGYLEGVDYSQRARVDCADAPGVTLLFVGVMEEDGGVYQCRISTEAGVHTTSVLLTVMSHGLLLSEYLIYIYVGGGIVGLVVISGIFLLIWWHRRKRKTEEYRVKLHPVQRQRWMQRE